MKWKIWPRQYGKTHQLREWWLEDPANRVILCGSENLAQNSRHYLKPLLEERYPGNTAADNRRLLKFRVMSYKTWLNGTLATRDVLRCQVAVDDLEFILPALFKADVVYAAGAGQNDIPDPVIANQVEEFKVRHGLADYET